MTKKHFEAMAQEVRLLRKSTDPSVLLAAEIVENSFVHIAGMSNPRFDADKFRSACRKVEA